MPPHPIKTKRESCLNESAINGTGSRKRDNPFLRVGRHPTTHSVSV